MQPDSGLPVAPVRTVSLEPSASPSVSAGELTVGLLVLAWERLSGTGAGPSGPRTLPPAVPIALGVAESVGRTTASALSAVSRTVAGPAHVAGAVATSLPGGRRVARALSAAADELATRGELLATRSRTRTVAFLEAATSDGRRWAEAEVAPQLVDSMVPELVNETAPEILDGLRPYLVEKFGPELVEGLLPEIRSRVVPVLIADIADDPQIREMVLQQSRGMLAEATEDARSKAADADDWLEQRFRRLFRRPRTTPTPTQP